MIPLTRLALLPLLLAASAAHTEEVRCLTGGDGDNVHLEWKLPEGGADEPRVSYVRYAGKTRWLRLTEQSQDSTEMAEGRPWQFDTVWEEHVRGRINGHYAVSTQGARIYGFEYTHARSGRRTVFHEDLAASTDAGCRWR